MKAFVDAVRDAIKQENWYAALALALTLPDICGDLEADMEARGKESEKRYVKWWETYLSSNAGLPTEGKLMTGGLSGNDCYALRCSFLHQGLSDISHQRARLVASNFLFTAPPGGGILVHLNNVNGATQLQIDIFCEDICKGVEQWEREKLLQDANIQMRAASMLVISTPQFLGFGRRGLSQSEPQK